MAYRASMGARGWIVGLFAAVLVVPSCVTDHDALAKRPGEGGQNAGGRNAAGSGGKGGSPVLAAGTGAVGSAGRPPDEPRGTNVLTLVHGVVDAERVRVCFRVGRGEDARFVETPEGAEALGYGASVVVRELEGVDFEQEDVQPVIVSGELELVSDRSCEEAVDRAWLEQSKSQPGRPIGAGGAAGSGGSGGSAAEAEAGAAGSASGPAGASGAASEGGAAGAGGATSGPEPPDPPALRVGELPLIPAGTLVSGRSWLYVANGCIGGPAFVDTLADAACGELYTPERPTLSAMLVRMSRNFRFDTLGLQVAHASVATSRVSVRSSPFPPSSDGSPGLADQVGLGEIVPRQARVDLTRLQVGAGLPGWRLEVLQNGAVLFTEGWSQVLERSGVESVDDGQNYVLVLIGPRFDLSLAGFWNPPAIALVASAP